MKFAPLLLATVAVAALLAGPSEAQLFSNFFRGLGRGVNNIFVRPVMNMFHGPPRGFRGGHNGGGGGGGFRGNRGPDGGTKKPQSTGIDETYPDDCGRDDDNKGKLCFPDGLLCQQSKTTTTTASTLLAADVKQLEMRNAPSGGRD